MNMPAPCNKYLPSPVDDPPDGVAVVPPGVFEEGVLEEAPPAVHGQGPHAAAQQGGGHHLRGDREGWKRAAGNIQFYC